MGQQYNGGYKVENDSHETVVGGGIFIIVSKDGEPGSANDLKKRKVEGFCTESNPNMVRDVPDDEDQNQNCEDKEDGKFKWKNNKKITCHQAFKNDKCSKKYKGPNKQYKKDDRKLWFICPKSCKKCHK